MTDNTKPQAPQGLSSSEPTGTKLTRADVIAAQGAYGEPIAASCWGYGYTVARCMSRGFLDDAVRTMQSMRRVLDRCDNEARAYCLLAYREGRHADIS